MDTNITSKFKGDATDLYVELAGDLYNLCQKYAELGTVDEVIHGKSVMAQNFDKVLNEFENLIVKFDKGRSEREHKKLWKASALLKNIIIRVRTKRQTP